MTRHLPPEELCLDSVERADLERVVRAAVQMDAYEVPMSDAQFVIVPKGIYDMLAARCTKVLQQVKLTASVPGARTIPESLHQEAPAKKPVKHLPRAERGKSTVAAIEKYPAVQRIKERVEAGVGIAAIRDELNKEGIKTPKGCPWNWQSVYIYAKHFQPQGNGNGSNH